MRIRTSKQLEEVEKLIAEEYSQNCSLKSLAMKYETTVERAFFAVKVKYKNFPSFSGCNISIGNRLETYFSEQELMVGYVAPSVSELKGEELEILKSL